MLNDIRPGFNSSLMGRALFSSGIGMRPFFVQWTGRGDNQTPNLDASLNINSAFESAALGTTWSR